MDSTICNNHNNHNNNHQHALDYKTSHIEARHDQHDLLCCANALESPCCGGNVNGKALSTSPLRRRQRRRRVRFSHEEDDDDAHMVIDQITGETTLPPPLCNVYEPPSSLDAHAEDATFDSLWWTPAELAQMKKETHILVKRARNDSELTKHVTRLYKSSSPHKVERSLRKLSSSQSRPRCWLRGLEKYVLPLQLRASDMDLHQQVVLEAGLAPVKPSRDPEQQPQQQKPQYHELQLGQVEPQQQRPQCDPDDEVTKLVYRLSLQTSAPARVFAQRLAQVGRTT